MLHHANGVCALHGWQAQLPTAAAGPPDATEDQELGSPEGGVTLDSGAWGEVSDDSSSEDELESELQDLAANLAGRSSSGVSCRF